VLLTGCTTTIDGQANPESGDLPNPTSETTTSSDSGSDELPTDGAPKVDDPIDTTRFQDDPCLSLTASQVDDLSLGMPGQPFDGPLGKACKWRNEETRGEVQVRFLDEDPTGLSSEYRANDEGKWEYFEELPPIEGHPAVARSGSDTRDLGDCTVVIGASDEIAFELALQLSQVNVGEQDPCEKAAEVAGMAVQTMQQG
jgi:hypothetical protein